MKTFLIFISVIALSYASVLEVTNDIEEEAIRLWQKFCEGKQISSSDEPGTEDNTYVYCKPSQNTTEIPVFHETTFPPEPNPDKVVVFIRPPAIEYNHNVTVRGQGPSLPKTVIYVKPVEHNHSISVESKTTKPGTERPVVYYLKKGHGVGSRGQSAPAPAPATAPYNNRPLPREPNTPFSPPNPYFLNQGQEFDLPAQEPSATFLAQQNIRAPQYAGYNGYSNYQRRYNN